jgi:tripartite-type tricarboxylate transporter receptor subunit TctC
VLLLGTPTTHVLLPARVGEAPADTFLPWIGLGSAPNVLLVSPLLGARSVEELVAAARGRALTYASAGAGQTIHLCSALFCAQAGIGMRHRPYDRGSATAYADLAAGNVQVYFDSLLGCLDRIAAGEAMPVAVSSRRRSALLPGVPTLVECGFPHHALEVWLGVFASGIEGTASPPDGQLASELAALGLTGGPIDAAALMAQVDESRPGWLRALDASREA